MTGGGPGAGGFESGQIAVLFDAMGYSFSLRTRDFAAKNRTVQDLIEFAYQVRDRQISGAPSWMTETRFDMAGKPDAEGLPSLDQYRLMIKKLLASRFQLRMHIVQQTFRCTPAPGARMLQGGYPTAIPNSIPAGSTSRSRQMAAK